MRSFAALSVLVFIAIAIGIAIEGPSRHGIAGTAAQGSGRSTVYVAAAGPCPPSARAPDVVASGRRSSGILPPHPSLGIACRYEQSPGSSAYALVRASRITAPSAQRIAALLEGANEKRPTGTVICPAQFFEAIVLAFGYANGQSVDLWYQNSGCQTLDNGNVTLYELENPTIFEHLSSIVSSLVGPSTP